MIDNARVEDLRSRLTGELILPADSEYNECRKVFNGMHDRRPSLIARCACVADVVAAINFGRENRLLVAVRSGGHSVAGLGVCEGGLLVDLAGLKRIEIDPQARIAVAGGGVLWGEFDFATQLHSLHTPGGRVTTTGLGGFTTGGGYGWTSSKYGLACDNLISAEVVLADGQVVTASAEENEDLFWGIRGGGGNFGIVTEFKYRLHPLGPIVLAGLQLWPMERAPEVMRAWRDYADSAPDELSTACAVVTAPCEEWVPHYLRGQVAFGVMAMFVGDPDSGATVVQPFKDLGPVVDLIQPMPYSVFQSFIDPMAPKGHRNYWRGEYLNSLSEETIQTFLHHAPELVAAAKPFSQVILFRIGQGVAAIPSDATAFPHREAGYLFHPISMWQQPADDERLISMSRTFCTAMRPFGTGGAYLNFTPEDRVRDAYGEEKYTRLVALKDRYDPDNLFQLNQNIRPGHRWTETSRA